MAEIFILDVIDERLKIIKNELKKRRYTCYNYPTIDCFTKSKKNRYNYVFAPRSNIIPSEILPDSNVYYFIIKPEIKAELEKKCKLYCVMTDEGFTKQNSYLTAEGALAYVILNTDKALPSLNILCLGYGYLGKAIVNIFNSLGIKIAVSARNESRLSEVAKLGNRTYPLCEVSEVLIDYDVIINTIPATLFDETVLLKPTAFLLELASNVYAFDYSKIYGAKYIIAKSLPSKTSVVSAAELLLSTIIKRKKAMGEKIIWT